MLKEDPQFFTTVLHEIRQKPDACLFLDDVEANVSTTKWCGLDAHSYEVTLQERHTAASQ